MASSQLSSISHVPGGADRLSDEMKRQCNGRDIHDAWERDYRSEPAEQTWEAVFDWLTGFLQKPAGSQALDIGCGKCYNAVRLARRGYQVSAGDYSEAILPAARRNVAECGLADQISINRQDILALTYPEGEFDLVLCYGVLMHIPAIEQAISELVRVCKPGGFIVLEEISSRAPEALLMRGYWRLFKGGRVRIVATPQGLENSSTFAGGTLFWRHTDFRWLENQFAAAGCVLRQRHASMFSELYKYVPGRLVKNLVHAVNRICPKHNGLAALSYHNLLIFEKQ